MSKDTRTLLITREGGEEIQVDIPERLYRIYESEKMQRAIFTDVTSFRDMSIPIRQQEHSAQRELQNEDNNKS